MRPAPTDSLGIYPLPRAAFFVLNDTAPAREIVKPISVEVAHLLDLLQVPIL